jgi:transcriptional regulator with GAF, ATPase, and Fis domain
MSGTSDDFPTLSSVRESMDSLPREGAPQLLILMDGEAPMLPSQAIPLAGLAAVEFGRGAERKINTATAVGDVRLADRFMSTRHARLSVQGQRFVLEDLGSKNGTLVNGERRPSHVLQDGDLVELGHTLLVFCQQLAAAGDAEAEPVPGLATFSAEFAQRRDKLKALAPSPVSVLVRGETGTGKELMARGVHQLSGAPGAFVAVNCGALPAGLLESELFGYRKGAFSGALKDHVGLVRAAEGGTLFLDEIGDLPLPAQAALLRVLQEREVLPIGEVRPVKVDFRLISATHRDLEALVSVGEFRQDLYARISGFVLDLPPLRERREDLGLILRAMLRRMGDDVVRKTRFGTDALLAFYRYDWPLNVRELEKYLEAAIVLAGDKPVRVAHLPDSLGRGVGAGGERGGGGASGGGGSVERPTPVPPPSLGGGLSAPPPAPPPGGASVPKERTERTPPSNAPLSEEDRARKVELEALLKEHRGNVTAVAAAMGKARVQIRRWMKRYGLSREE